MEIRIAKPGDEHSIIKLVKELAEYENEPDAVFNTAENLAEDLFKRKLCEAYVAELDGQIVGFALFYTSYSTWNGACLYLEDLYVQEKYRSLKVGSKLFDQVVQTAKDRQVRRMVWQILNWNKLAIDFYNYKNATIDDNWVNGRLFFN
jgi:GNAT superfamily N-acetyltransferase